MRKALTWIGSALLLPLPLFAIHEYSTFQYLGGYAMAPAVYAAACALAATLFEGRWSKKLLRAGITAAIGMVLGCTFDVLMILAVTLAFGAVAVGVSGRGGRALWKAGLYRLLRTAIAISLVFATTGMNLQTSGKCPGGGGDITEVFTTFAVMTYLPLAGVLLVDLIARLIFKWEDKKDSEPATPPYSEPAARSPQG
ncbi:MAG TPA: hypothetical protein P5567_09625 [Kiritimatiellia bacterium]|nr:hypothetical protein [Kiritimatiellia bacterium]HSA19533.1 hypothetical protein [Kiritimatiellia bacterium]